ncbi:MAG: DUF5711 family protein [Lachnospiraceae bacterium]
MAEVSEKLRREVLEEKRRSRTRKILALLLVLLFIIAAVVSWRYLTAYTYESYTITSELPVNGQFVQYQNTGNALAVLSNDGAKGLSGTGELLWEISYQLDNPVAASCGSVTAIADVGGKNVYVVAENGIPHNYQVLYPIVKLATAGQGVTAVLLNNGTEDYIQLYDMNGTLRVDINTKTKTDGFPIDIALSEDGKKLVTLYLTFDGDAMISKVTFYNAGEVGKNHIGNVVGQKSFGKNVLAAGVRFLNNDTVCILKEDGFSLYRMQETPALLFEQTFEEPLYDIVCSDNCIVVVTENAATKQKTMLRYDANGKKTAVWNEIADYERLVVSEREILLFSPQKVIVYRNNKSEKFVAEFERNLEAMLPAGGNQYFLIDTGRIQTIKLSGAKEEK